MLSKFLFPLLTVALPLLSLAQSTATEGKPESPYKITFSGYVRADALFDSRQAVEAREAFLLFYPKKPVYDREGNDINASPAFNQYAMCSRLTAKVSGPEFIGAKTLALIEGDFTGASNAENNSMRLRHAYFSLQWNKTRLLAGQYWHPQDIPEMIPNVLSLNTGAPFHSFSRQPQIRIDHKIGSFNLVGVIASQRDYVNNGPEGNNSIYLRNSILPNLHAQVHFKKNGLFLGTALDYKMLTPRLATDSNYLSNESVKCLSYSMFGSIKVTGLEVKAQYTMNRALNDHLMMGGFGVTEEDPATQRRTYEPMSWHSSWLNIAYTATNWQPSIFMGYTVDATEENLFTGSVYARNADIDYVYRVSPMLTFLMQKFSFMCELEFTAAAYKYNETDLISIKDRETQMIRVGIGAVYSF